MRIIDPHIDIASIYDEYRIEPEDFYSERKDIPVSKRLLEENDVNIVGATLFMDPSLRETSMYDGVMAYHNFYWDLFLGKEDIQQIKSTQELAQFSNYSLNYFYSIEGLECFRTPDDFFRFYDIGVRSFGLVWEYPNDYATGNSGPSERGLTSLGKSLLKEMSKFKLSVDTAHLNEQSFRELGENFDGVIINTHANARTVSGSSSHNLTDEQIQIIVDHQGIICLLPTEEESGGDGTFADLYKHVEYIATKWGLEYVGISSDIYPSEVSFINKATNVSIIKEFRDYLLTRMSKDEVEAISFKNFYNILEKSV